MFHEERYCFYPYPNHNTVDSTLQPGRARDIFVFNSLLSVTYPTTQISSESHDTVGTLNKAFPKIDPVGGLCRNEGN